VVNIAQNVGRGRGSAVAVLDPAEGKTDYRNSTSTKARVVVEGSPGGEQRARVCGGISARGKVITQWGEIKPKVEREEKTGGRGGQKGCSKRVGLVGEVAGESNTSGWGRLETFNPT